MIHTVLVHRDKDRANLYGGSLIVNGGELHPKEFRVDYPHIYDRRRAELTVTFDAEILRESFIDPPKLETTPIYEQLVKELGKP